MKHKHNYKKIKFGYKIVQVRSSRWYSWIRTPPEAVEYELYKRTYPNNQCGPLYVFKSLFWARYYRIKFGMGEEKILKVIYLASDEQPSWLMRMFANWFSSTPRSTVFAASVLPIKVIE